MKKSIAAGILALMAFGGTQADARRNGNNYVHGVFNNYSYDRHALHGGATTVYQYKPASYNRFRTNPTISKSRIAGLKTGRHMVNYRGTIATQILPHPSGCPHRAFCGCGVALRVFGKAVRAGGLALAREWFRFPHAHAAPGMVAVRRHHVFYIERVLGGNKVLAYDPNSGGHLTRMHIRSLNGYSVRNPKGSRYASV